MKNIKSAIFTFISSIIGMFLWSAFFEQLIKRILVDMHVNKELYDKYQAIFLALIIAIVNGILEFVVLNLVTSIKGKFLDSTGKEQILSREISLTDKKSSGRLDVKLNLNVMYSKKAKWVLKILKTRLKLKTKTSLGQLELKDGFILNNKYLSKEAGKIYIDFLKLFSENAMKSDINIDFTYQAMGETNNKLELTPAGKWNFIVKLLCVVKVKSIYIRSVK